MDNRHYRVKTENVNRLITSLYLFVVLRMYLLLISLFIDLLFRVSICISFIYVLILSTPVIFLCIIFLLILTHFLVTDQHNNKICYFCAISTVLLNAIILSSTCLYFLVWYFSLLCGYLVFFSFMWLLGIFLFYVVIWYFSLLCGYLLDVRAILLLKIGDFVIFLVYFVKAL